jgi:hypothetical protein
MSAQVDYVNVSFCRNADDLHATRQHLDKCACCLLPFVTISCQLPTLVEVTQPHCVQVDFSS